MPNNDGPDAVGYKQPPRDKRFTSGQSGNPRGRPKKNVRAFSVQEFLKDIIEMLEEEITVTVNGRSKKFLCLLHICEHN